jgi:hypothetical protein
MRGGKTRRPLTSEEKLALEIYDRLNPDHYRVINVSKDECNRMAREQFNNPKPRDWRGGQESR